MANNTCNDLPSSLQESVVLLFDLADYTVQNGPSLVGKVLEDKKFQEAVKKALDKQALALVKRQQADPSVPVTGEDGTKFLKAAGSAALDAGAESMKRQIERSSAYLKLEQSLRDLHCSFKKSPVGVWVDENQTLLVIIASGLALGGATAMYVTRTGDLPAGWAADLAEKKLKSFHLGKITLGVEKFDFKPSERELGAKVYADTSKWKGIPNVKFSISAAAKDDKLTSLGVAGEVTVPIAMKFAATAAGSADPILDKYSLSLGVRGGVDGLSIRIGADYLKEAEKTSIGAKAAVDWKTKVGGTPLIVSGTAGIAQTTTPGPFMGAAPVMKTDASVHVNLSIPFDFP